MHPLLENANNLGNAMISTDRSSTDLLDFLFGGYDKRIRPFSDQQRPVIIEMTIVLAILTELVCKFWFVMIYKTFLERKSTSSLICNITYSGVYFMIQHTV